MTNHTIYLRDTLGKRIAHGKTSANDLPLLDQLLICERRQFLMVGASAGAALVIVLLGLVHLLG